MIDSTDEWIRTRSGIQERRWAAADGVGRGDGDSVAAREGAGRRRDRTRADRLRAGRHGHPPVPDPVAGRRRGQPARRAQGRRVRHLGRLRRLRLRAEPGRRDDPRRQRRVRAGDRRGAALRPDRPQRPVHRLHLRRRRGRGRGRPVRHAGHRPGGLGRGRLPARRDRPDLRPGRPCADKPELGSPRCGCPASRCSAGPPTRWSRWPSWPWRRPASPPTSSTPSSRTRPTCGSRTR